MADSTWLWIVFLTAFLLISSSSKVRAKGIFELRIDDIGAPTALSRSLDSTGDCCLGRLPDGRCVEGPCGTEVRVCLKHYQAEIDPNPPCTIGESHIPFQPHNSSFLPLKVSFEFAFAWTESFSLIIDLWHKNDYEPERLVNRVAFHKELKVNTSLVRQVERVNNAIMDFSFRVICAENHYNSTCTKYCRPRNDKFGHYDCGPDGEPICLDGWKGLYCEIAVCLPGCRTNECEVPNTCKCKYGWEGELCEICMKYPGCAQGTCNQPWQCNCREGWGGLFCNQDLNYCTNHKPCKNNGACTNTGSGSFTCQCQKGYGGKHCEQVLDNCYLQECLNGGECLGETANYTCFCPVGFYGPRCETTASPCTNGPCGNGGTCSDVSLQGYKCWCTAEFTGPNCQIQKNACNPNPCNDGECILMGNDTYSCTCLEGTAGDNCEKTIDFCVSKPCLNTGLCESFRTGFKCYCVPGYVGETCELRVNHCVTKPCANGGTCTELPNSFQCKCQPGFTDKYCTTNIDDCQANPCQNGGKCVDLVNEFKCNCSRGYSGKFCEQLSIEARRWSPELSPALSLEQNRAMDPLSLGLIIGGVLVILLIVVGISLGCWFFHQRQKRQKEFSDAEAQNEQNIAAMNNKCLEPRHIMNALDLPNNKVLNNSMIDKHYKRTEKTINVIEGDKRASIMLNKSFDLADSPKLKRKVEECSHKNVYVIEDNLLATQV